MKKIIRLTESDLSNIIKRVIKEQTEKELVGKTIDVFTDSGLSEKMFTVKVGENISIKGNSIDIQIYSPRQSDGSIVNNMIIKCGSNMVTLNKVLVMMGGSSSQKTITGYVSQKLVDYLKPLICKETQETPTKPSDF
jgi:hypothetical protein